MAGQSSSRYETPLTISSLLKPAVVVLRLEATGMEQTSSLEPILAMEIRRVTLDYFGSYWGTFILAWSMMMSFSMYLLICSRKWHAHLEYAGGCVHPQAVTAGIGSQRCGSERRRQFGLGMAAWVMRLWFLCQRLADPLASNQPRRRVFSVAGQQISTTSSTTPVSEPRLFCAVSKVLAHDGHLATSLLSLQLSTRLKIGMIALNKTTFIWKGKGVKMGLN